MKYCKYCGMPLEEDAAFCTSCGGALNPQRSAHEEPKADMTDTQPGARRKKLLWWIAAAAVVLSAVVLFAVVSSGRCEYSGCKNKAISGFDYCYTHKCAVSDCNFFCSWDSNFCYSHKLLYDGDAAVSSVSARDLRISIGQIDTNSISTFVEGTLTNNSDRTVSFVRIKGAFETAAGTVVDTDWTYAVGSEGLAPGESTKWRLSVDKDRSISDCSVTIIDFDA